MGSSKSHEFSALALQRRPDEWQVIEEKESYQLWQRRNDNKIFMAYPVNQTEINSEEKLQLYNFRKLNHGNLVAVECVLSDEDSLCSVPRLNYVLVENIPVLLATLSRPLTLAEALTVLSAAFAGYNTLNYVYGPLFTSEHMIGFTAQGVPKVWVSQNFSSNQPSRTAVSGGQESCATSIEERSYCCVQKIFDIVEGAVGGGYPGDLKSEAGKVTSFAEGEEFVDNYCRRRGIFLEERINLRMVEPLNFRTETNVLSERFSLINYGGNNSVNTRAVGCKPDASMNYLRTLSSTQHPTLQYNQTASSQISLNIRPLRSTLNNSTKINFIFNGSAVSTIPVPVAPAPALVPVSTLPQKQNIPIVQSPSLPERQPQLTPVIEQSQHKPFRIGDRPHIDSVQSKQEILIHPALHQQDSQEDSQQFYQLKVHEVKENEEIEEDPQEQTENLPTEKEVNNHQDELQRVITSESVEQQGFTQSDLYLQTQDELKKWEESLLKLSEKQKRSQDAQEDKYKSKKVPNSDEEQYLSQERDKVHIDSDRPIQSFNTENELEAYIRNKYKQYLTSQEEKQPQTEEKFVSQRYFKQNYEAYEAYDPQLQQQTYEQRVAPYRPPRLEFIEEDYLAKYQNYEESDQRKYTFGKIEIDPIPAKQQYSKAQQKQQVQGSSHFKKGHDRSILEDRYNKYVKNREPRTSLNSKDISSILRVSDSSNRKDLLQEYLHEALPKPLQSNSNSLTYDKLRELLWA